MFKKLATWLAGMGVSPNTISLSSLIFAAGAGGTLAATSWHRDSWELPWLWILSAVLIQLRLLANMLDGMVAIESGKASPVGELYNEIPDRISDAAVLVGSGYAIGSAPFLGYSAALAAILVAYVRAIGWGAGVGQIFSGPMAKPQRMFLITLTALYCGLSPTHWQPPETGWGIMAAILGLIIAGGLITAVRRLVQIGKLLKGNKT